MKLSARLCIYAAGICLAIFIAIAVVMEVYSARSERNQAERVTRLIQVGVVDNIESRVDGVELDVSRTAQEMSAMGRDFVSDNTKGMLGVMLRSDTIMKGACVATVPGKGLNRGEWMLYVQLRGNEVSAMQLGGTDYGYTTQEWFARPVAEGKAMWSSPYIDNGAGDCLMSTYTMPLADKEGEIGGVITADIGLGSLDEQIHALIPYNGTITFILNDSGTVLDRYPAADGELMGPGSAMDMPDGGRGCSRIEIGAEEYLCCFTPVEGIGLVVCSATPVDAVMSVTSGLRLPLLMILAIGFMLLILGLRMMLTRSTRPLSRLADAAKRIGDGDFDTPLPDVSDYSDLGRLHDGMDYMKESIKDYIGRIAESARESERMASQLDIARKIQRSMLPAATVKATAPSERYGVEVAAMQQTALEVGGDLYDYLVDGPRLYFIIADVSGKGIPAALMMAYIKSLFQFAAQMSPDPASIVSRINANMCVNNSGNMFATMLAGCVDMEQETLTIVNAGHNPAIMVSGRGVAKLSLPAALPVGIMPEVDYANRVMKFAPGDMLLMYTDGVTEAEDQSGRQYGEERLVEAVKRQAESGRQAIESVDAIAREVDQYCKSHPGDDITMLCLKAMGGTAKTAEDKSGVADRPKEEVRQWTLQLAYNIAEVDRLSQCVRQASQACGWPESMEMNINLAAEEAVANVIKHARPASADDMIEVNISGSGSGCEVTISDSGAPFNPLDQAPEVDVELPLEQREAGGLGVFLIRQLSHKVTFRRRDGKNVLTFVVNSGR